ncbi:MAG TPA: hypothetical protein VGD40_08675 [Chryseosolibacter sp.]
MAIHIGKPYRIIAMRYKRYNAHYQIPSDDCLVVPTKEYGTESLCDVRWEDTNGVLQVIHNKMFLSDNLAPLNAMLQTKLYEIWEHYYNKVRTCVAAFVSSPMSA